MFVSSALLIHFTSRGWRKQLKLQAWHASRQQLMFLRYTLLQQSAQNVLCGLSAEKSSVQWTRAATTSPRDEKQHWMQHCTSNKVPCLQDRQKKNKQKIKQPYEFHWQSTLKSHCSALLINKRGMSANINFGLSSPGDGDYIKDSNRPWEQHCYYKKSTIKHQQQWKTRHKV